MALTPQFINTHAQGSQRVFPQAIPASGDQSATGAGGAATAITVTGQSGRNVCIKQVSWSYSDTPTGGSITIADSAGSPVTYFSLHVTAGGPGGWTFSPALSLPAGLNSVVTLAAPGGAIVGKLFVNAYVEQ